MCPKSESGKGVVRTYLDLSHDLPMKNFLWPDSSLSCSPVGFVRKQRWFCRNRSLPNGFIFLLVLNFAQQVFTYNGITQWVPELKFDHFQMEEIDISEWQFWQACVSQLIVFNIRNISRLWIILENRKKLSP